MDQVNQVSNISHIAPTDIGGQFKFPGVPDRQLRRASLVFRAGEVTQRHEFDATTKLVRRS